MFKTHFLSTIKFGGHKKIGVTAPECPTLSAGLGRTVGTKSSIGGLHVCAWGGRHSENLFLSHKITAFADCANYIINIFPQIPIIGS